MHQLRRYLYHFIPVSLFYTIPLPNHVLLYQAPLSLGDGGGVVEGMLVPSLHSLGLGWNCPRAFNFNVHILGERDGVLGLQKLFNFF